MVTPSSPGLAPDALRPKHKRSAGLASATGPTMTPKVKTPSVRELIRGINSSGGSTPRRWRGESTADTEAMAAFFRQRSARLDSPIFQRQRQRRTLGSVAPEVRFCPQYRERGHVPDEIPCEFILDTTFQSAFSVKRLETKDLKYRVARNPLAYAVRLNYDSTEPIVPICARLRVEENQARDMFVLARAEYTTEEENEMWELECEAIGNGKAPPPPIEKWFWLNPAHNNVDDEENTGETTKAEDPGALELKFWAAPCRERVRGEATIIIEIIDSSMETRTVELNITAMGSEPRLKVVGDHVTRAFDDPGSSKLIFHHSHSQDSSQDLEHEIYIKNDCPKSRLSPLLFSVALIEDGDQKKRHGDAFQLVNLELNEFTKEVVKLLQPGEELPLLLTFRVPKGVIPVCYHAYLQVRIAYFVGSLKDDDDLPQYYDHVVYVEAPRDDGVPVSASPTPTKNSIDHRSFTFSDKIDFDLDDQNTSIFDSQEHFHENSTGSKSQDFANHINDIAHDGNAHDKLVADTKIERRELSIKENQVVSQSNVVEYEIALNGMEKSVATDKQSYLTENMSEALEKPTQQSLVEEEVLEEGLDERSEIEEGEIVEKQPHDSSFESMDPSYKGEEDNSQEFVADNEYEEKGTNDFSENQDETEASPTPARVPIPHELLQKYYDDQTTGPNTKDHINLFYGDDGEVTEEETTVGYGVGGSTRAVEYVTRTQIANRGNENQAIARTEHLELDREETDAPSFEVYDPAFSAPRGDLSLENEEYKEDSFLNQEHHFDESDAFLNYLRDGTPGRKQDDDSAKFTFLQQDESRLKDSQQDMKQAHQTTLEPTQETPSIASSGDVVTSVPRYELATPATGSSSQDVENTPPSQMPVEKTESVVQKLMAESVPSSNHTIPILGSEASPEDAGMDSSHSVPVGGSGSLPQLPEPEQVSSADPSLSNTSSKPPLPNVLTEVGNSQAPLEELSKKNGCASVDGVQNELPLSSCGLTKFEAQAIDEDRKQPEIAQNQQDERSLPRVAPVGHPGEPIKLRMPRSIREKGLILSADSDSVALKLQNASSHKVEVSMDLRSSLLSAVEMDNTELIVGPRGVCKFRLHRKGDGGAAGEVLLYACPVDDNISVQGQSYCLSVAVEPKGGAEKEVVNMSMDRPTLTFYREESVCTLRVMNAGKTSGMVSAVLKDVKEVQTKRCKKKFNYRYRNPFVCDVRPSTLKAGHVLGFDLKFRPEDDSLRAAHYNAVLEVSAGGVKDSLPVFAYEGQSQMKCRIEDNGSLFVQNDGTRAGFALARGRSHTVGFVLAAFESRTIEAPKGWDGNLFVGDEIARSRLRYATKLGAVLKNELRPFVDYLRSFEADEDAASAEHLVWTDCGKLSFHYAARLFGSRLAELRRIDKSFKMMPRDTDQAELWDAFFEDKNHIRIINASASEQLNYSVAGGTPEAGTLPVLGDGLIVCNTPVVIIDARGRGLTLNKNS